jgi:hypothetical protein
MDATAFKDTEGRTWTFGVTVKDVRRVKQTTGVDLLEIVNVAGDTFAKLTADIVLLFDVMAALLAPALESKGLDSDDLAAALDEQSTNAAVTAMFEATIGFFQPAKAHALRTAFRRVWAAANEQQAAALTEATAALSSPEFDASLQAAMRGAFNGPGEPSLN